jgi:hypothetical protein
LSISAAVLHEVAGMTSFNKNIFMEAGNAGGNNKRDFIGAAFGK